MLNPPLPHTQPLQDPTKETQPPPTWQLCLSHRSPHCYSSCPPLQTQPLQDPASSPNPEPITCRSATRQLLVALLTLRHPTGDDRSDALIPGGTEDLLWWTQEGVQGYLLDSVVAVMAQLQELCEQARVMGQKEAAEEVCQVVPQVSQPWVSLQCGRRQRCHWTADFMNDIILARPDAGVWWWASLHGSAEQAHGCVRLLPYDCHQSTNLDV
jgi:hypothetical protein